MTLRVDKINLRPTSTAHLNIGGSGGGCVDPNTAILTSTGPKPIKDLTLATEVLCFDRHRKDLIKPTRVTHLRTSDDEPRFELNHKIIVSSTQPLFEKVSDWIFPQDLRVGMQVLQYDGSFEVISSMRYRGHGAVIVLGVADPSHTFIANGVVCHNITK